MENRLIKVKTTRPPLRTGRKISPHVGSEKSMSKLSN
jgi:hypothetical protein